MLTTDALRRALDGDDTTLTLDRTFQGLPDSAHGGAVLGVFDLLAGASGPRALSSRYRKRVPLGVPLRVVADRTAHGPAFALREGSETLVEGTVTAAEVAPGTVVATPPAGAMPLPISRSCFACGTDNPLGLGVRLRADDAVVGAAWQPPARFAGADGMLAAVALTTLLDEAAFWLGALATGESGMTTELRVTLHGAALADDEITIAGARAAVRPRIDDARYWDTAITARDASGRLVASAAITFVAVRGAARRLAAGMLAINPPELLHRVFPAYAGLRPSL
jgi:hypothetical protein